MISGDRVTNAAPLTRRLALASACAAALLFSVADGPTAHAQPTSDYGALIAEGLSEFELGNWTEAYTLFKRAHEGSPNARTLRGMGMTSYELKRYPRALQQLKASLASVDNPLTAEQRTHVEGLIERSSRLVGSLELTVNPPEAIVVVNREQTDKRSLTVPVGEVTVRAELPGHAPIERVVIVDSGQSYPVNIDFPPVIAEPAPPAAAAPAPPPTPVAVVPTEEPAPQKKQSVDIGLASAGSQQPTEQDSLVSSPWLWVGVGLAVVGGVVAGVLLSGTDDPDSPVPPGNVDRAFEVLEAP